jgi:hypothetical protein
LAVSLSKSGTSRPALRVRADRSASVELPPLGADTLSLAKLVEAKVNPIKQRKTAALFKRR